MSNHAAPTRALSPRESEVAGLVVAGRSNRAIAEALFLSERTVEHHISAVFNKLNIRSRIELVLALSSASQTPAQARTPVCEHNLPLALTSFVGRAAEIAEIAALVGARRMVTLTGSGGIGKTRTSLQVAANLLDGFGDGVWFIELAPLSRGEHVPTTVAQALGLALPAEGDPLESLVRALKGKHALLVFDNCEHVVEPAARVVSALLHGCPNVKILASSRQGLGIAGEETYRLPSLGVPAKNDAAGLSAIDALQSAAVALFVERACAASKWFALTDENAPIVADICRRLDGIPLAIELAAARVNILSPRQLRERLNERFRVLTGGGRDVLPRQQTLRALIDWSHDLLDGRERTLFRRLGIFVDSFTLEGAAALGSGADPGESDVFDVLASLVDKSLVLAEPDGDSLRYRLLESTRIYALERLDAAGERPALASRHLRYLRDHFAKLRAYAEQTGRLTELGEALQSDLAGVRSALDGAQAPSDVINGSELLADSYLAWGALGLHAEGIALCERYLLELPAEQFQLVARLRTALSYYLAESAKRSRAVDAATEAVASARKDGDPLALGWALLRYTIIGTAPSGKLEEAESAQAEAEAIPGTSALLRLILRHTRAQLMARRGDYSTAANMNEQLCNEHRSLGNRHGEVVAAHNLAGVEHARGQTRRAIAIVHKTLPLARSKVDKYVLGVLLLDLARYLTTESDLVEAVATAREGITILCARDPNDVQVAFGIEQLAHVFALRGDLNRAAVLEGYADTAFRRYGYEREFTETTTHERLTSVLRKGLSQGELARLIAEGTTLTHEAAIALTLEER